MRKNKLIELLNNIEGNPEIYLWNGFAGDWMDINPTITCDLLVKQSKEFIKGRVEHECKCDGIKYSDEIVDANFKEQEWEFPNPYLAPEHYPRWYGKHQKTIYLLQAKTRGKKTFDRLGGMEY